MPASASSVALYVTDTSAVKSPATLRDARELIRLGRRLDALLLLRRSLEEDPDAADPAARPVLAGLLEAQGETEAALAELGLALKGTDDPFPVLIQRGSLLARNGKPAEAEKDLREAIRQRPSDPAGHAQLGLSLLRRGRPAEAAGAFEEAHAATALRFAPDDPELLYQLGEALQGSGDPEGALRALERAAAGAPRDPRPLKLMGRLLDGLGRPEEAMAMHRRAREAALP